MTTVYTNAVTPFGRKVRILAIELGIEDHFTWAGIVPWTDDAIYDTNPFGRVPVLETEEGHHITESFNICEAILEIATQDGKGEMCDTLLPTARNAKRRQVMAHHALASGLVEMGIGRFREFNQRPQECQLAAWSDRYETGMRNGVAALESLAAAGEFDGDLTLGGIAVGCSLSWIGFRLADIDWASNAPHLVKVHNRLLSRPSFEATQPSA